jgi:eukaryotic-like serine/threonine-protein kinase
VVAESADFSGTHRFGIRRKLGAGGMGVVYEAYDHERQARVALKTLRHLNAHALYRFKNEFRALQDLEHPNLVSLGELIEDDGQWFFTMELVEGTDLLSYVRPAGEPCGPEHVSALLGFEPTQAGDVEPTQAGDGVPIAIVTNRPVAPGDGRRRFDEPRLRSALAQLAVGLNALHAAGKIHRDIKPSNVRVTPEGRVVLLDFGLVTDTAEARQSSERSIVGTAAYMAPEQAASKPIGPEADWYSVGVVLYEMLTGWLPFAGSPIEILMDKQRHEPPPPRARVPDVPADIDALCADLLKFDPRARPPGREVLKRLGADGPAPASTASTASTAITSELSQAPLFVGREAQLRFIEAAFRDTLAGDAVTVYVRGQSGLGKSRLIRAFTAAVQSSEDGTVVLTGRCYERETVPYKGLDGIVDALSRYMLELPKVEAAALVPMHAALLARVFPVLGRVEVIARAPQPRRDVDDLHELRKRAFGALRELLYRLRERNRLVLVIDDLQWADRDSLVLLGDLLRPPNQPPLLLLVSARAEADGRHNALPGDVREIELGALDLDDARRLAQHLLDRVPGAKAISAAAIAQEARGHPLYIDELVRHASMGGAATSAPLRLDDAIWSRVSALHPSALRLLELVCVAGSPLARHIVSDAADMAPEQFARDASLLRVANLVRGRGGRRSDTMEAYHDRVREAVLEHLNDRLRAELHARLAIALEMAGAANDRPELLLRHLEGAGHRAKAAAYAREAAQRASQALAFDRAAEFYRTALRLGEYREDEARTLRVELADSLAYAGRSAEAAAAYLEAAHGQGPSDRIECWSRAAHQLLISGRLEQGMAALRQVSDEAGIWFPETSRKALLSFLWHRTRLRLRRRRLRERHETEIAPQQLVQLDVYKSASRGLGLVDPIRAADFHTRGLVLALKTGEKNRVLRGLAEDAIFQASHGGAGIRRGREMLAEAKKRAQDSGSEYNVQLVRGLEGVLLVYESRFREAAERVEESGRFFRERASKWGDLNFYHSYGALPTWFMGDLIDQRQRVETSLLDAERRGDLYQQTTLLRFGSYLRLSADDPVRAEADIAQTTWVPPEDSYHIQHYLELVGRIDIAIYCGDTDGIIERFRAGLEEFERSVLPRGSQIIRCWGLWLRGRLALAAGGAEQARRIAGRLERIGTGYGGAWAKVLLACAHVQRGAVEQAIDAWWEAITTASRLDMNLCVAVARRRLGELIGGDKGAELIAESDRWMRDMEVADPARFTQLYAPQ